VEAIPAPPSVDQSVLGVLVAGEVTLTGQGLGAAPSLREIRFDYDSTSTTIDASSSSVVAWSATEIRLTLPPEIRSGQLTVIVEGQSSASIRLDVFEFTTYPLLTATGEKEFPLALDVDSAGRVWINQEAHDKLNWLTPATASAAAVARRVAIPQATGSGIYAGITGGVDQRTYLSQLGEDLDIASNGDVWFTAGGGFLYNGQLFNTSRIVRYRPSANQFDCYTVPTDSAEAVGVLLDEQSGLVWYTESSLTHSALSSFQPDTLVSDCLWTPYGTAPRPPICEAEVTAGCHRRYVLPPGLRAPIHLALAPDGSVWFSEFWGNRIVRLDANTGDIVELPLPPPIVRVGPGTYAGSGPWELFFDDAGDLWLSESFDGTVSRVRPSLLQTNDCTVLDASLQNPCVEEVFVGSDGYDEQYIHSVAPGSGGRIWFTHAAGVGYVSTEHSNTTVLLPSTATTGTFGLAGIVEDPVTHDVWFAMFYDKKIGRLRLAQGDGDALDTPVDNCPIVYNPGQGNADRNFIDLSPWNKPFNDLTWPASDSMGDACDNDADNDGLANVVEETGMAVECPSASSATNPLLRDTDNDLVLDGAECALGSDPASALSRPAPSPPGDADRDGLPDAFEPQIGADPTKKDTDGDKIGDGIEYKSYGTRPDVRNSDGDACADGYEAASLDASTSVNSLELLLIVLAFGSGSNPNYVPAFDVNRDGNINAGDLLTVAILFGPCKPN
jgi:streptogramin lyase